MRGLNNGNLEKIRKEKNKGRGLASKGHAQLRSSVPKKRKKEGRNLGFLTEGGGEQRLSKLAVNAVKAAKQSIHLLQVQEKDGRNTAVTSRKGQKSKKTSFK